MGYDTFHSSLLNACLQLDESEPLDIEGFAHEVVPWEPSQEAGGGYASESDASDVSHAFINASVQTTSQMDGTFARLQQQEPAADGARRLCAPTARLQ